MTTADSHLMDRERSAGVSDEWQRLILRESNDETFAAFEQQLLNALNPSGPIERILAERVVLAASRLRLVALSEDPAVPGDASWCRYQALIDRNFRDALNTYERWLQNANKQAWAKSEANGVEDFCDSEPEKPREDLPVGVQLSAPSVAEQKLDGDRVISAPTPNAVKEQPVFRKRLEAALRDDSALRDWRDHIAIIPEIEERWPVLERLRIRIEDVIAMLEEGYRESELLQLIPGLTRSDITACLQCEAEGRTGPFDPPYPIDLPVRTLPKSEA